MNDLSNSDASLPPLLEEAFATLSVFDETGKSVPLNSNVSRDEALLLNASVRHLKPDLSIEIGLAKGASTLAILSAIEKNGSGKHLVCDPFQENYANAGVEMVRRAGLDAWWTFYRNYAEEIVPSIDAVQFAFVDASHLFDLTLMEFVLIDKKLDEGGVIGFHDMWMPSLQKMLRYILENRNYEIWSPPSLDLVKCASPSSVKMSVATLLNMMPMSSKLIAPEIRKPWEGICSSNLVLLRKLSHDKRDWKFHAPF